MERPERLRAIYTGLAAALARLGILAQKEETAQAQAISAPSSSDELVKALEGLGISRPTDSTTTTVEGGAGGVGNAPRLVVCEPAGGVGGVGSSDGWRKVLRSKAVQFVHEPEEDLDLVVGGKREDRYLEKLAKWGEESAKRLKEGKSEIPEGLPQGDLYREYRWLYFDFVRKEGRW